MLVRSGEKGAARNLFPEVVTGIIPGAELLVADDTIY
jgi:hypothetical protein